MFITSEICEICRSDLTKPYSVLKKVIVHYIDNSYHIIFAYGHYTLWRNFLHFDFDDKPKDYVKPLIGAPYYCKGCHYSTVEARKIKTACEVNLDDVIINVSSEIDPKLIAIYNYRIQNGLEKVEDIYSLLLELNINAHPLKSRKCSIDNDDRITEGIEESVWIEKVKLFEKIKSRKRAEVLSKEALKALTAFKQ